MNPQPTIDVMRTTAQTLRGSDVRDQLRALQTLQDATDAAKAVLLAELEYSRDYELDGASTINTWVRNQLRLNAGTATTLIKNVIALRELPLVAEAATTGQISAAHVQVFRYGLTHIGLSKMREFEDVFVAVALQHDPSELFDAVKHLKDVTHPENLDDEWERGMDKEDFQVNAVPDGWHVSGFLNTVTGAKLKKVLDSVSAPHDAEDTRTGSQRRVQGLDDLLSAILAGGLPSDKGVKPHLSVLVDAETLQAAADHVKDTTQNPGLVPEPMPPVEPAQILNAGRERYQPNLLQRRSVIARHIQVLLHSDHGPSEARQAPDACPAATESLGRRAQRVARPIICCTEPDSTSPATRPTDSPSPTAPADHYDDDDHDHRQAA